MKKLLFFSLSVTFSFFIATTRSASEYDSPKPRSETSLHSDSIPELNQQILDFVNTHLKKKVGRGECWDLAAEALNQAGATWNHKYNYGKRIDPDSATVFPGDIIQFEGVKLTFVKDGKKSWEQMYHHTAVVYAVKSAHLFDIAHQHTAALGKKVGISTLNLDEVTKGKYFIYRPQFK